VSGGRGNAAELALAVFTSLARNDALPKDVRLALCRNAAFVENTRPGAFDGYSSSNVKTWLAYDRAFAWWDAARELGTAMLQENLHNGTFVATPPGQVPLTPFDLDVNGAVCAKPGFAPPPGAPFACGDRASAGDPRANGGWAPAAAAASTAARRRSELAPTTAAPAAAVSNSAVSSAGDLYLDLVVRSLTDYLGADLTTDWKANAVSSTADTGLGSATASDADGTAWDLPLSLGLLGSERRYTGELSINN
jgi:hypothetical protein